MSAETKCCPTCGQVKRGANASRAVVLLQGSTATMREREVLEFIAAYRDKNDVSPTLDEVAGRWGIRRVTAWEHVQSLISKGLLSCVPHRSRSIMLA
jgi:SOS-response transcriptional repressor LexA